MVMRTTNDASPISKQSREEGIDEPGPNLTVLAEDNR